MAIYSSIILYGTQYSIGQESLGVFIFHRQRLLSVYNIESFRLFFLPRCPFLHLQGISTSSETLCCTSFCWPVPASHVSWIPPIWGISEHLATCLPNLEETYKFFGLDTFFLFIYWAIMFYLHDYSACRWRFIAL